MSFLSRLDELEAMVGAERLTVRSYKQERERLPQSAVDWLGLTREGLDMELPAVNRSVGRDARHYPDVVSAIRRNRAGDLEAVTRRWFPGQAVEEVFDFPER
jgi:hypothetical protein